MSKALLNPCLLDLSLPIIWHSMHQSAENMGANELVDFLAFSACKNGSAMGLIILVLARSSDFGW